MLKFIDRLSSVQRLGIISLGLLAGLASVLADGVRIHATGIPVVLATAPVDPRSLFQGDYVVLSYPISWLEYSQFPPEQQGELLKEPQEVYVELEPGDPVWKPIRYSLHPLRASGANVVLKGSAAGRGLTTFREAHSLRVTYGLESFLVPEGEGRIIEQLGWTERTRITVRALVAPDGAALPQNILIDGKPAFSDAGL